MAAQVVGELIRKARELTRRLEGDSLCRVLREGLAGLLDPARVHYLENCLGCGDCTPACLYALSLSPLYSPVDKSEYMRRLYRADYTVTGRLLGRLAGACIPRSLKQAYELRDAAYLCSNCGYCYMACPMGIDSGALVFEGLRSLAFRAGYGFTPLVFLSLLEERLLRREVVLPEGLRDAWNGVLDRVAASVGRRPRLGCGERDYCIAVSIVDVLVYPESIAALAGVLEEKGFSWALPSQPLGIRPPLSYVAGMHGLVAEELKLLQNMPGRLVFLDGGYPYAFLRFDAARYGWKGGPPLHVVEVIASLGEGVAEPSPGPAALHMPCQLARRAGAIREAEEAMRLLYRRRVILPHHGSETLCCGGGALAIPAPLLDKVLGLFGVGLEEVMQDDERRLLDMAEKARRLSSRRIIEEFEHSGADVLVTLCPICMVSLGEQARPGAVRYIV